MKIYAPYKKFRWGIFYFPLGYRYTTKKELKELKKCPIELGELKNGQGKVINKPKPEKSKTTPKN